MTRCIEANRPPGGLTVHLVEGHTVDLHVAGVTAGTLHWADGRRVEVAPSLPGTASGDGLGWSLDGDLTAELRAAGVVYVQLVADDRVLMAGDVAWHSGWRGSCQPHQRVVYLSGPPGNPGVGIDTITAVDGIATITLTDGTTRTIDLPLPQGAATEVVSVATLPTATTPSGEVYRVWDLDTTALTVSKSWILDWGADLIGTNLVKLANGTRSWSRAYSEYSLLVTYDPGYGGWLSETPVWAKGYISNRNYVRYLVLDTSKPAENHFPEPIVQANPSLAFGELCSLQNGSFIIPTKDFMGSNLVAFRASLLAADIGAKAEVGYRVIREVWDATLQKYVQEDSGFQLLATISVEVAYKQREIKYYSASGAEIPKTGSMYYETLYLTEAPSGAGGNNFATFNPSESPYGLNSGRPQYLFNLPYDASSIEIRQVESATSFRFSAYAGPKSWPEFSVPTDTAQMGTNGRVSSLINEMAPKAGPDSATVLRSDLPLDASGFPVSRYQREIPRGSLWVNALGYIYRYDGASWKLTADSGDATIGSQTYESPLLTTYFSRNSMNIYGLTYLPEKNVLIPASGDWNYNADPAAVVEYTLDGQEKVLFAKNTDPNKDGWTNGFYSDAVGNVYEFDGNVYAPHVDGSGFWDGCGYATDQGGAWHNVRLPGQAIHVFQMLKTPDGFWMCGSSLHENQATGSATIWFCPGSVIDESKWTLRYREPILDTRQDLNNTSRYYWMRYEDGKVWVEANDPAQVTPTVRRWFTPTDQGVGTYTGDQGADTYTYKDTQTVNGVTYYFDGSGKIFSKPAEATGP